MTGRNFAFAIALLNPASGAWAQEAGDPASATPPAAASPVDINGATPAGELSLVAAPGVNERLGGLRAPEPAADADCVPGADEPVLTVDATISFVSDFRRGGISSNAGKATVQGELAVAHRSGFYGSLWASGFDSDGGADVEVDLAAGYAFSVASADVSVGAIHYVFPGVADSDYVELQASVGHDIGPASLVLAAAYTPKQNNSGDLDNLYLGVEAELPFDNPPVTLSAAFGRENGAFGDRKLDWSLGAVYALGGIDWGISYVDSARTFGAAHSGATLILSISKTF